MAKPILITGCHRSGSTWVGKMLGLSPEVFYISEPFNPKTGLRVFKNWFQYIRPDEHPFGRVSVQNERDYQKEIERLLEYKAGYSFNLAAIKYWTVGRIKNKRPLLKDPIATMASDWLSNNFNMDTVVIFRHPAAFYNSLKRLNWHFDFNNFLKQPDLINDHLSKIKPLIKKENKTYAEEAAILWLCIYTVLDKYIKKNPNWIVLRHEDLAQNPVKEFKQLYKKLDLQWTDKIEKEINKSTSKKNKATTEKVIQTKRDSRGIIDVWRKNINQNELKQIEAIAGILAKKYNYDF